MRLSTHFCFRCAGPSGAFLPHTAHRSSPYGQRDAFQGIRTRRCRRTLARLLEVAPEFHPRRGQGRRTPQGQLLHRHPAAQRHRGPAHGACPQYHPPGHHVPLHAPARQDRPVGAGHGPRGHRHAERGGEEAPGRRGETRGPRARGIHRARLGVERGLRRTHPEPDPPPRRQRGLDARAFHHGRGAVQGRS